MFKRGTFDDRGTARPRSVLVLGGGSDIGLAIARALVTRGARAVILAARHPEALDAPTATLRAMGAPGVEVETIAFDAEQIDTHEAIVASAFTRNIDVAILAFGLIDQRTVLDESPAEAGHVAAVNFAGAVSSGLAVAQQMRAQGHGTLLVLSSLAGQRARPAMAPYAASKAGLDAFTDALREALRGSGVRVVSVRPGWVRTKMTTARASMLFAVTPERVADDVLHGLDRGSYTVWSPGVMRYVAIGIRWTPRGLFNAVSRVTSRLTSWRR